MPFRAASLPISSRVVRSWFTSVTNSSVSERSSRGKPIEMRGRNLRLCYSLADHPQIRDSLDRIQFANRVWFYVVTSDRAKTWLRKLRIVPEIGEQLRVHRSGGPRHVSDLAIKL